MSIIKQDKQDGPDNYRLVSPTSMAEKITEQLLWKLIKRELKEENIVGAGLQN